MRIIVVEDESRVRAGIVRLIERECPAHIVVGETDNGVDGMYMIKQLKPDLVFTDIQMPRMNGLKMIQNLKESGLKTNIVILTAYSEFEYAKIAIRYGVSDYLLKPVTAEDLISAIDFHAKDIAEGEHTQLHCAKIEYSPVIESVINMIRLNYHQKISLSEFASRLHMSASYLSGLFSKELGVTFSAYLRDYRIERAKELLKDGNCYIFEVAYRTGFDNTQYFCRCFKKVTGYSTSEYLRDSAKQGD